MSWNRYDGQCRSNVRCEASARCRFSVAQAIQGDWARSSQERIHFPWLIVSIETTYRSDHGGFYFTVVICNLKVEFNFYDIRHWNDAAGRYNLESEYETKD
jgi:hypothetical protein